MTPVRWYRRAQAWALTRGAGRYDALIDPYKRWLLSGLSGSVLELGPGGGTNLPYLARGVRWIGVEPNPFLHRTLAARAAERGLDATIVEGVAERLPVPDHSIDAVVGSLVLCSVPDPDAALREVRRVLRPGGRYVFIEHVAAPRGSARWIVQHALRPLWGMLSDCCHPARETARAIQRAGFVSVTLDRFDLATPLISPHIAGTARV